MRYFFDLRNGVYVDDEEGIECPSDEAAIAEAGRAAAQMSADIASGGRFCVEVRSSAGSVGKVTVTIEIDRTR
jgi:hypothetical protein